MKYAELNDFWIKQGNAYREWRMQLFDKAAELRQLVIEMIEPPENWTEPNGKTHPYISIVAIAPSKERSYERLTPLNMEMTENGVCIFGLSFAFSRTADSFPKNLQYCLVAIRFEKRVVQYCLWDLQKQDIVDGEHWNNDKAAFIDRMIGKLAEALTFDPKEGLQNKPNIGLI